MNEILLVDIFDIGVKRGTLRKNLIVFAENIENFSNNFKLFINTIHF